MFNDIIITYHSILAGSISPVWGTIVIAWWIFTHGGWVVVLYSLVLGVMHYWDLYVLNKYDAKRTWVNLAVDVPKDNIQSPKAVESIFVILAGTQSNDKFWKRYFLGEHGDWFSFDIVGIEGNVQFIIRTVDTYKDLVEAAIYGQYPDAEITQVEDYTDGFPTIFPNDKYQMWGTEFSYVDNNALPIRTYTQFEDASTKEFKDPLQAVLEVLNKLGEGEQLWFQMLLDPINSDWKKDSEAYIAKLMGGKKKSSGPSVIVAVIKEFLSLFQSASDQIVSGATSPNGSVLMGAAGSPEAPSSIFMLPPHVRMKVEGATEKMRKIAFSVKMRLVYIGRKENFVTAHGREAFIGAIKQLNTEDLNALKPDKKVSVKADYILTDWRKNMRRNKLMKRYVGRSMGRGVRPIIMNVEELATIWHFPVKTEFKPMSHMVQRTQTKTTPPPTTLPMASWQTPPPNVAASKKPSTTDDVPPNLPIL